MKIDTEKATPVKGSPICKLADNPYILINKNGEENEDKEYGRELNYIPTLIYSPVLSSKRTPKALTLVSDADVEELSAEITKMVMSDAKEKTKETKEDEVAENDKKVVLDAKDRPLTEPLGRYEVEVVTNSKAVVRVTRSLRLF